MKKKPEPKLIATVPAGRRYAWSSFWADTFHAVWADGKIGYRSTTHTPTPDQITEILENIPIAIEKCEAFIAELKLAENLLTTPEQKRNQARMAKLIQEHDKST